MAHCEVKSDASRLAYATCNVVKPNLAATGAAHKGEDK